MADQRFAFLRELKSLRSAIENGDELAVADGVLGLTIGIAKIIELETSGQEEKNQVTKLIKILESVRKLVPIVKQLVELDRKELEDPEEVERAIKLVIRLIDELGAGMADNFGNEGRVAQRVLNNNIRNPLDEALGIPLFAFLVAAAFRLLNLSLREDGEAESEENTRCCCCVDDLSIEAITVIASRGFNKAVGDRCPDFVKSMNTDPVIDIKRNLNNVLGWELRTRARVSYLPLDEEQSESGNYECKFVWEEKVTGSGPPPGLTPGEDYKNESKKTKRGPWGRRRSSACPEDKVEGVDVDYPLVALNKALRAPGFRTLYFRVTVFSSIDKCPKCKKPMIQLVFAQNLGWDKDLQADVLGGRDNTGLMMGKGTDNPNTSVPEKKRPTLFPY